ncbi:alcohol dehydrogenase [Paxillus involutus ATCC 200175]|uniref:alcohol dehydrogenase n=1 Tax=Paxillus involutus ATCC 200175 TaxID=664439 RepID=A0A0C9TJX9_PAXIN|nr:alcohol dehydrogenase [Paxillus involutus ATCC 200175]
MTYDIPTTQIAAVVSGPGKRIEIQRNVRVTQPSELKPGQCLVKLICTGVCHTDLHASRDDWPIKAKTPLIGGHEGIGEIVAIADNTESCPVVLGQRVGIKWIAYCCRDCEQCRKGLEQDCVNVELSGFGVDGTFCQYVQSWVHQVTPIPDSLDSYAAASILCAGLTVYRALKYCDAKIGDWIVIPGAGGGLGHLAVQYAVAMGMRVLSVDTGEEKKKLCLELGAEKWIDFKDIPDLVKGIRDACDGLGPHCAIVTSPYAAGYSQAVEYLRQGGTLMAVGLPGDANLEVSIFWTVIKSITIKGSYVGNRQDAIEAMEIAASGKVKVKYELKGLSKLQEVYEGLEQGRVAGRIVLECQSEGN